MSDQENYPHKDRRISGVYVSEITPLLLPDKALVWGDVTIFLEAKPSLNLADDERDGPKMQLSFSVECDPATPMSDIYKRIFDQAQGFLRRLSQETSEGLLQHMFVSQTEAIGKPLTITIPQ